MSRDPGGPPDLRPALRAALALIVLSLALKVPSLWVHHGEPDERVYWSVAQNLLARSSYSLQGTEILSELSPHIYDRPLFHHPPLFAALLVPFVAAGSASAAVVVSWLGHALCILAVALVGGTVAPARDERGRALLWLALLGVATDPLLTFVSRKLWIDPLLAGLGSLAVALAYVARARASPAAVLGAGGALGLAALAKLPGLLVAPVAAAVLASGAGGGRARLRRWGLLALPAALLMVPWLVAFWRTYGVLLPTWLEPDAWNLARYPLVAEAVARPWYYYVAKMFLGQPVVLLVVILYALDARRTAGVARWAPLLWLTLLVGVATVQGAVGYGFQMRYVAPAAPAAYAALFCLPGLGAAGRPWARPALMGCILYGILGSSVYLVGDRGDELLTLFEGLGWVRF